MPTPAGGQASSWATSIALDPSAAPEHPACLPTAVTTPGTNTHPAQMQFFFTNGQPCDRPASSSQIQHETPVQSQGPSFPQPFFASPARSSAASLPAHVQTFAGTPKNVQQSPGSSPSRSQAVQNFNAQPPGPSRALSGQFSQLPDGGMPQLGSRSAMQPGAGPASRPVLAQQPSGYRQPVDGWSQTGQTASPDNVHGRQDSGAADPGAAQLLPQASKWIAPECALC